MRGSRELSLEWINPVAHSVVMWQVKFSEQGGVGLGAGSQDVDADGAPGRGQVSQGCIDANSIVFSLA